MAMKAMKAMKAKTQMKAVMKQKQKQKQSMKVGESRAVAPDCFDYLTNLSASEWRSRQSDRILAKAMKALRADDRIKAWKKYKAWLKATNALKTKKPPKTMKAMKAAKAMKALRAGEAPKALKAMKAMKAMKVMKARMAMKIGKAWLSLSCKERILAWMKDDARALKMLKAINPSRWAAPVFGVIQFVHPLQPELVIRPFCGPSIPVTATPAQMRYLDENDHKGYVCKFIIAREQPYVNGDDTTLIRYHLISSSPLEYRSLWENLTSCGDEGGSHMTVDSCVAATMPAVVEGLHDRLCVGSNSADSGDESRANSSQGTTLKPDSQATQSMWRPQ